MITFNFPVWQKKKHLLSAQLMKYEIKAIVNKENASSAKQTFCLSPTQTGPVPSGKALRKIHLTRLKMYKSYNISTQLPTNLKIIPYPSIIPYSYIPATPFDWLIG